MHIFLFELLFYCFKVLLDSLEKQKMLMYRNKKGDKIFAAFLDYSSEY